MLIEHIAAEPSIVAPSESALSRPTISRVMIPETRLAN